MNNTLSEISINSFILPSVSLFFQLLAALLLCFIKKLENSNYIQLIKKQDEILETVSRSGGLTNRLAQEPYEESEQSTHRDYPINNDFVLRIKK